MVLPPPITFCILHVRVERTETISLLRAQHVHSQGKLMPIARNAIEPAEKIIPK
jgi:hypothetical protein